MWVELDRRQNDQALNGFDGAAIYTVQNPTEVRELRLKNIGPNHNGNFFFCICCFEIFGEIRATEEAEKSDP